MYEEFEGKMKALIKLVSKNDLDLHVYVLEEMSELTKTITKLYRRKGIQQDIFEESCDVLCTVMTLLHAYGYPYEEVRSQIEFKLDRGIERISNGDT